MEEIDGETKAEIVWDVVVLGEEACLGEEPFPGVRLVRSKSFMLFALEDMSKLRGWSDRI